MSGEAAYIKQVGIVGCGFMGSSLAQLCAQSGYKVTVVDVDDEILQKGLASVQASLTHNIEKGKISKQDRDVIKGRITGTTNLEDLSNCDIVIESVIEKLDVKKAVFAKLDSICSPNTILITNTSSLSVIEIASLTKRLDKILGMHFFYPPTIMKLVEVIRTVATSDESLLIGKEFGKSLGKTVVVAKDTPGFIVNRLIVPFILDAIKMLEDGIATKEDIDTAVQLGLNHPMGPLTLVDYLGFETLVHATNAMYEKSKDPKFIMPSLVNQMIIAGWNGRKSGRGFYEYDKK